MAVALVYRVIVSKLNYSNSKKYEKRCSSLRSLVSMQNQYANEIRNVRKKSFMSLKKFNLELNGTKYSSNFLSLESMISASKNYCVPLLQSACY